MMLWTVGTSAYLATQRNDMSMTETIFQMKLLQLQLSVQQGAMTPNAAIEAACKAANDLGLPEYVTDALKAQPPVLKGGE